MSSSNETKHSMNRRDFVRLSTLATAGGLTVAYGGKALYAQDTQTEETTEETSENISKCPVVGHSARASANITNHVWWPNQLNLKILHQNSQLSDPMGDEFNYAEEFNTLDLDAVKKRHH